MEKIERFNKGTEDVRKNQMETLKRKNAIMEIKNSLNELNSGMKGTKERINGLEMSASLSGGSFPPHRQLKQPNQGESSFVLEHYVLLSKTYFREKNMLIESSDHFAWMNSYSGQDFCDVLFCGILCLLLYNACGTGYSNWFC